MKRSETSPTQADQAEILEALHDIEQRLREIATGIRELVKQGNRNQNDHN